MTRVLIADDDQDDLDFLYFALDNQGYSVYTANDGEEALQQARDLKPDLVILDVMMPKANGTEIAPKIRAIKELQNVPIIFLTGLKNEHDIVSDNKNAMLAKPLQVTQLLDMAQKLLPIQS